MGAVLKSLCVAIAALALSATTGAWAQGSDQVHAGPISFEALPAQRLERGQCGLFLWAQTTQPVFIVAVYDRPAVAIVNAGGRQRTFSRVGFTGNVVSGVFERQRYESGGLSMEVEVEFDDEQEIRDGAMVKEGVVRVRDREGWETIVPIGGMAACKS